MDLCGSLWIFVDLCGSLWIFMDICVDIASSLIYMLVGLESEIKESNEKGRGNKPEKGLLKYH